jgi:hypothetical protein
MYLATSWTMYRNLVVFLDPYFGEFLVKKNHWINEHDISKKIGDNAKELDVPFVVRPLGGGSFAFLGMGPFILFIVFPYFGCFGSYMVDKVSSSFLGLNMATKRPHSKR